METRVLTFTDLAIPGADIISPQSAEPGLVVAYAASSNAPANMRTLAVLYQCGSTDDYLVFADARDWTLLDPRDRGRPFQSASISWDCYAYDGTRLVHPMGGGPPVEVSCTGQILRLSAAPPSDVAPERPYQIPGNGRADRIWRSPPCSCGEARIADVAPVRPVTVSGGMEKAP